MIHFAISRDSLEVGIGRYLQGRGASIHHVVRPMAYEDVLGSPELSGGTWIFSALDCLTPSARELASSLRTQLHAQGHRVLNDPGRSLLRFDLLSALYDAGINSFRAVRASDYRGGLRFPVFLRTDRGHRGNHSPLLHSESAVKRELLSARLRRMDFDNLLVVEFRDLSEGGVYHKYSAFRVGDRILSRHAQRSRHWMIKSETGERTDGNAQHERQYIETGPHDERLAPIFALAGIEYGRVDYACRDGRLEVWEINTAPTMGSSRGSKRPPDDPYRRTIEPAVTDFHQRMCRALASLDDSPPAACAVEWDQDRIRRWRKEAQDDERRQKSDDRLIRVANLPALRGLHRGIERVLRAFV